ncbi:MAG TPA: T9SS type A sorting domain-containing protein, partial [Chitinophagales bacterium]|nr:T9SS type A sorting domain-containing protein [Chitinophagales bacterium]HNO27221.1 T9SS type A sorting domain-containing protein [Chitinophagales bacterium]
NDGTWGANLPAMPAGTDVRYYIEAIADDGYGTRSYDPVGAEHDVYYYQVRGNVAVEDFIAETINVYPNPATDMVQIILPSSNETADIELFSLGGNSVLNQLNYKSGAPLNISKIAPGCYFLHTKQNEVTAITKIIIQ